MTTYKASVIKEVYADFHTGEYIVNCPYCEEINVLPNGNRGQFICGNCNKIFNVK